MSSSPEMIEANLVSLDSQLNSSSTPLAQRFRALFTLKSIGTPRAIEIIGKGPLCSTFFLQLETDKDGTGLALGGSALLGHEEAYCLGQIKDPLALPILQRVLEDDNEHVMVRHEAAEAMGAIGDLAALPVLKLFLNHPERALRETAEIAVAKIEWDNTEEGKKQAEELKATNLYPTIDPAPASLHSPLAAGQVASAQSTASIPELQATLLNTNLSLFERYRAMFALRNDGGKDAVLALASGFGDDSALFRLVRDSSSSSLLRSFSPPLFTQTSNFNYSHEIAYVFGQLSSPHSVPSLVTVLRNKTEDDMVRHEAAEALGGIATDDCLPVLKELAGDENCPRVVKESCEVALDMYEHERSTEFSYATPLSALPSAITA
ncbi:deoxyhypusine monooxygenase, partial [Phenoliferia sp. Uapishka_3]